MSVNETVNRWASKVQLASLAIIVVSLLLLSRNLPLTELIEGLRAGVDGLGIVGPAVFAGVYIVATVLFLPGSLLTLAIGAIFGLWVGFLTVSVGSTIGAGLAFLIGRYVAREKVAAMAAKNAKSDAIDRAIAEGGWKIVAMLRLSPAVPFNLQNYLFGLTPVRFVAYFFTSWVAMMPGTFLYVYLGHITGAAVSGPRDRTTAEWVALVVGLLATIAVSAYITVLAKRKLSEQAGEVVTAPAPVEATATATADRGWPWGATVAAVLALLAASTATYAQLHPENIVSFLSGIFGPPRAQLEEVYEERADGPAVDHALFDGLMRRHVEEGGWVDYEGLAAESATLKEYLHLVAEAPFDELGRNERLALLINGYNAFTLRLILDHYPVASIKDIPKSKRWADVRWTLGGHRWSLNQIEHEQVRPKFAEPRIHFALVCAAAGCPPLRSEAFVAERLEEQLDDQTRYVHGSDRWLQLEDEGSSLRLTQLYDWYGSDFEQVAGSVIEFVARYVPDVRESLEGGSAPRVGWIDYDWSLNEVSG